MAHSLCFAGEAEDRAAPSAAPVLDSWFKLIKGTGQANNAFFITLNKTEKDYSPTTMYDDYALDETHFHWQSQSTTSATSPTGRHYINHRQQGGHILLFVREFKKKNNLACPYFFLGPAQYVSHTGSRPMSIIWRLQYPMPGKLLRATTRLAAA